MAEKINLMMPAGKLAMGVLTAFCLLLPACHRKATRPIGVVRGTVTVAGKPVTQGMIVFENPGLGVTTTAPLEANGAYQVRTYIEQGLPVGSYTVSVSPQQLVSEGISIVGIEKPKPQTPSATIPEKYRTTASSPLRADVHEGDNPPFDFDLTP